MTMRWTSCWAALALALGACAGGDGSEGVTSAVEAQVAEPAPARGGASNTPRKYDDPELECFQFRAHAAPDRKGEKYSVPTTPDLYTGFTIKAPWSGVRYIKTIRSLVDNAKVVHHWQIYLNVNGGHERVAPNANPLHADAELLYGFAPGTHDLYFDDDVGMVVQDGAFFELENHYNNRTGVPQLDSSGVELCVTPKKPEHVAALSFVGSMDIRGTTAKGTCTHQSKEPVHLIMGFPHMHVKGIHMKIDWTRADGTTSVVHDKPFDFDYQSTYLYRDVVLAPGDKLTTTCTYGEPARIGKGTDEEMCYFFSVHWPAGSLARDNLFARLQASTTCID
ncbi:MAG: hypothetical protein ABW252_18610 [Polyangiales bacterium]